VYTVITENDESEWADDEGVLYNFPKRYEKYLIPGTIVIYYKGKLTKRIYSENRLSDSPHYFGIAEIDEIYPDRKSSKNDLFATIKNYRKFKKPILAKRKSGYFEEIPDSRKSNYWRDGVRPIRKEVFDDIVGQLSDFEIVDQAIGHESKVFNDSNYIYESAEEGQKNKKYVSVYERKPKLRRQAIAIHGANCIACDFNFKNFYGAYAEGFIHIHHVIPVSEFDVPKNVNPETDLVPLCANCHSVVHRRKDKTLSIHELKKLIQEASNS